MAARLLYVLNTLRPCVGGPKLLEPVAYLNGHRHLSSSAPLRAKKVAASVTAGARPGIEVESDATKLTKFCCGANIYNEGSDPEIKPDSEYPDWLWNLDCEPHTRSIEELDKNTFKYWRKVRKTHIKRQNAAAKLQFL